ncbi:MAG: protein kinase [Bacteroidales bacterium]|jgi:serine/threonine protein kinase|nr:protein kinase [Bacteroidales bacterium]
MKNNTCKQELIQGTSLSNEIYVVEKVIGIGGFGITYLASNKKLKNYYAIKEFFINGYCIRNSQAKDVILQGINEDIYQKYRKKFFEEAKTLSILNHPNIVKVIDVFYENNTSYIVMPFIEGQTLQCLVDKYGKLNYETSVNYIAQICDAVAYIHQKDILHRDIKPDNIIITPENNAILIDFGSAREFIQDKTQNHTSILTQGYAPLEQYSTISKKGSYSDIYAVGATFYFALTGQKPMDATSRTIDKMSSPKQLIPNIPENADLAIMKAMQLKSENRYQNVQDFVNDIMENNISENHHNLQKGIEKVVIIGRSADNDIVINDLKVSRHHLQIIQDETGNFYLADFGSTNGTFVNGKKISGEINLFPNDVIKIGETILPWNSYFSQNIKKEEIYSQNIRNETYLNTGKMPKSYQRLAIVVLFFCIVPLGIFLTLPDAIKAYKIKDLYLKGDIKAAQALSKRIRNGIIWSIISAVMFWVIIILYFFNQII